MDNMERSGYYDNPSVHNRFKISVKTKKLRIITFIYNSTTRKRLRKSKSILRIF